MLTGGYAGTFGGLGGVYRNFWGLTGGYARIFGGSRGGMSELLGAHGGVCRSFCGHRGRGVVVVVVVRAPSTCRREKLPNTLSLGRAQGSSRPASRWPGVCRQRPRGGGGFRLLSVGGRGRVTL